MAQEYSLEAVNTFVKGLITEAGELTFPKDASVDELNCDLLKTGARRRRLSVEFESGYEESTETVDDTTVIHTTTWENVGGEPDVEFLVVQLGSTLLFYQKYGDVFSTNRVDTTFTSGTPYTLDLSTFERDLSNGAETAQISTASIDGKLIVASPEINTLYISRDTDTGEFTATEIKFRVRDFEWQVSDKEDLQSEGASSPDDDRVYDTKNSGWIGFKGGAALTTYITDRSAYPPITLPWYSGKDSDGNFKTNEWRKIQAGNTLAVNGHYIVNLYNVNRNVGGITGYPADVEDARFSTVCAYSGRVFYSGIEGSTNNNGSKIFFSQLLDSNFKNVGHLYQTNDPTSEILSDLLDTDGGYVSIQDAYGIKMMHVFGSVLYVFAANGVWSINGVDDVFRATEYTVSKVSEDGLEYRHSFVSANGRPYWWSSQGIYTLSLSEGTIISENISRQTIQTYWENIGNTEKDSVISIYDGIKNRVLWLYKKDGETVTTKFNKILVFDETLASFFPWSIGDQVSNTSAIIGVGFYSGLGSNDIVYNVVDGSGNQVVDGSGNEVITTRSSRSFASSRVKLLVRVGGTNTITFAEFTGIDFLDWGEVDYSSYAEAAYNFMGDMTRSKNTPYITTYLKSTETGWVANLNGGFDPIRPSSCKVSFFWDFKSNPSSVSQETYRLKPMPIVDEGSLDTWDYPSTVVTSRLKPRGRGKSVKIRYESTSGKDFHLLGWEVISARNTKV